MDQLHDPEAHNRAEETFVQDRLRNLKVGAEPAAASSDSAPFMLPLDVPRTYVSDGQATVPGKPLSLSTHATATAAGFIQSFAPPGAICKHLCAFHCHADNPQRHIHAHHYCSHLTEEFRQCVLYDSPAKDARLIGIEYVISARLFDLLPAEEKRLWHSHAFEVKSGMLALPGLPEFAASGETQALVGTYGKAIHTWQIDRDELPIGLPSIMMSYTAPGQMDEELLAIRDEELGYNREDVAQKRKDYEAPELSKEADVLWNKGIGLRLKLEEVPVRVAAQRKTDA